MPTTSDIDWRLFFTGPLGVRNTLFGGKLTQQQVDGMNRVASVAFNDYGLCVAHAGYILATAYHETGKRMHPVREGFARSDESAKRILEAAWVAGKLPWVTKPYWRTGYFGRGEVQLTWLTNYKKMNKVVKSVYPDVDIVEHPNLIIDRPEVSTLIMVHGMVHGMFTGKKLADYGDGNPRFDHSGARAIINPHEYSTYDLVGGYSVKFMQAFERAIR